MSTALKKLKERAKTAVFWDVKECPVPKGLNCMVVSLNIREALAAQGFNRDAFSIYAYGDLDEIKACLDSTSTLCNYKAIPPSGSSESCPVKEIDYHGTTSVYAHDDTTQIDPVFVVNHTPEEREERRFKMLTDILCWSIDNSSPANVVLVLGRISNYEYLYKSFTELSMSGFNVILAQPESISDPVSSCYGPTKWFWEDLSSGHISPRQKRKETAP